MKLHRILLLVSAFITCAGVWAANPMATGYDMNQCEGSLIPYPRVAEQPAYPDSLKPVFINHVGRHGSRYPASSANCIALRNALAKADSLGTITTLGRSLQRLNNEIINLSHGRWGALDSVGISEQQGIAARMYLKYADVFTSSPMVEAMSSYSPRAMMSMYAFTHQLDRLNNQITFTTSTGRINSKLLRPFDLNQDYLAFRREKKWEPAYKEYMDSNCPVSAIKRVLGNDFPFGSDDKARDLALVEYYVLAGCRAMGLPNPMADYFTETEANALWSCFNLRQYLQRTASTVSKVPADIASDLVLNIISAMDAYVSGENTETGAILRFGHAETLMPLFSLLKLPGCDYLTNYFDTVAGHWQDFDVVPMAANIQFILFKSTSGRFYVRVELNEKPLKLRRGDNEEYFPWGELRRYMMDCVPLYAQ